MSIVIKKKEQLSQASPLRQIASAAAWVMQNADHIKIDVGRIPDYYRSVCSKYSLITHLDPAHHFFSPDKEEMAAYILALDSINFGSGYFDGGLEYTVIAEGLKTAFETGELYRPEQWLDVTPEYFSWLLSVPVNDLMILFARHLCASGEKIMAEYQGRVLNLVEEADASALQLAEIVSGWESFRDISVYKGQVVPFFKRAQILAADMHLALSELKDVDKLTMFADNMVPHVLRCDGILEYDTGLASAVEKGVYLEAGSTEEVEIRAAAIHVVELIKQEALLQWPQITSVKLDHILWHRGHESELYKRPRHRTLTTAY
ncbi:MAG: hypothetical protein HY052_03810 [Proteobacteria bacterium]|nr:hypothetical protein [Pseudomonadota bacterium]